MNATNDLRRASTAVTSLCAALLGIGLSRLVGLEFASAGLAATQPVATASPIYDSWYSCFLIALMLFFRFLVGTNVHLEEEHGSKRRQTGGFNFIWDILFLAAYGWLGARACYADSVREFLRWISIFLYVAIGWGIVECLFVRKPAWIFWMLIDIAQAGIFTWCWLKWPNDKKAIDDHCILRGLVIVSVLFLVLDFGWEFGWIRFPSKKNLCQANYKAFRWGNYVVVVAYGKHALPKWTGVLRGSYPTFKIEFEPVLGADLEFVAVDVVHHALTSRPVVNEEITVAQMQGHVATVPVVPLP